MPLRGELGMTLQIGDTAPNFEAGTTEGVVRFHDWIADKWVVLFSHPKEFTPVGTPEHGYMAKIKPEFDKRGVKTIGLSVDPLGSHHKWASDIKETQGFAPNYPMIADAVRRPGEAHARRQPDRTQRLRHRPGQEDQARSGLSDDHRPQFRRGAARDRFAATHRQAQGVNAGELEARRGRDHLRFRSATTRPRSNIRRAGRRPSPISASCRSRRAERTGWSEVSMRVCRKVRSSAIRTNYKVQYGGTRL